VCVCVCVCVCVHKSFPMCMAYQYAMASLIVVQGVDRGSMPLGALSRVIGTSVPTALHPSVCLNRLRGKQYNQVDETREMGQYYPMHSRDGFGTHGQWLSWLCGTCCSEP